MTTARAEQINISITPFYHVMSRCVRRNFLCGFDKLNQTDYTHRKAWIVDRIKFLSNIFAIKTCAYAVMSNHYHIILFVDEDASTKWSDEEVISRWKSIFPKNALAYQHIKEKIKLWRENLSSISWFMKCLNEHIARAANIEANEQGRFWDGRFKAQALIDEGALLSAMVYVDLNPIRAGLAQTPENSEFTSIMERIKSVQKEASKGQCKNIDDLPQPINLIPFRNKSTKHKISIDFSLQDYIDLVDATGRLIRTDKKSAKIPDTLCPILERLNLNSDNWSDMVQNVTINFSHAIGAEIFLIDFSNARKKKIKGASSSRLYYQATS